MTVWILSLLLVVAILEYALQVIYYLRNDTWLGDQTSFVDYIKFVNDDRQYVLKQTYYSNDVLIRNGFRVR